MDTFFAWLFKFLLDYFVDKAKAEIRKVLAEKERTVSDAEVAKLAVEKVRLKVNLLTADGQTKTPQQIDEEGERAFQDFFDTIDRGN